MKIRVSSRLASRILQWDSLLVGAFCLWWAFSSKNSAITFYGAFASMGLLDLSERAKGKKVLDGGGLFVIWGFLFIVAITTALASLGLCQDGLGLLSH